MPPSLFHLNMNIKDSERGLSLFLSSFYLGPWTYLAKCKVSRFGDLSQASG